MKKKYIALAVFLFVIRISFAQSFMIDSAGNKVPVPKTYVHSKPPEEADIQKPKPANNINIVKGGLFYFASGCLPVFYERKVLPWLSIEAGLGLTTRDFMADGVNAYISILAGNQGMNPYYQYSERKSLPGIYISAQPKFYVHNDALEGFWFGPVLEFKRFDYKANLVNVNALANLDGNPIYLPNSYQNEYRNAVDFTFNVGWQWFYNHHLTLEYLMGAGFRRFWEQRSDIEATQSYSSGPPYFTNGVRVYGGYRPEINVELNFGGFF